MRREELWNMENKMDIDQEEDELLEHSAGECRMLCLFLQAAPANQMLLILGHNSAMETK